ncbi:MAG: MHFG family PEP-CTERM protein [Rubrivivax sp.]|nr:MHFG family PEP-CTERM protein [Rubrivivax sp.]MDP3085252.1 MHFG family PEP-CTERM protein [Rubrivivax sp.]
MSLILAATLAASVTAAPACSWDRPGHNPFIGDIIAAVDHYTDMPVGVRAALKARMAERRYDEIVTIGRDAIVGRHRYAPDLRDMHFGSGQVCRTVTRKAWGAHAIERGLVYCESGHCVIVPTVCRNLSRVTRLPDAPESAGASGARGAAEPGSADAPALALNEELQFEAPAAGPGTPSPAALSFAGLVADSAGGGAGPLLRGAPGSFGDGASAALPQPPGAWPDIGLPPLLHPTLLPTQTPALLPTPGVPEPASWILLGLGVLGLAGLKARRQLQP